jgi:hypothetical protein
MFIEKQLSADELISVFQFLSWQDLLPVMQVNHLFFDLCDKLIDILDYGNYVLQWACFHGSIPLFERFIDRPRVDPSVNHNFCIRHSFEKEIVKRLLSNHNVDPSALNNHAIFKNFVSGNEDVFLLLLQDPRTNPNTILPRFVAESILDRSTLTKHLLESGKYHPLNNIKTMEIIFSFDDIEQKLGSYFWTCFSMMLKDYTFLQNLDINEIGIYHETCDQYKQVFNGSVELAMENQNWGLALNICSDVYSLQHPMSKQILVDHWNEIDDPETLGFCCSELNLVKILDLVFKKHGPSIEVNYCFDAAFDSGSIECMDYLFNHTSVSDEKIKTSFFRALCSTELKALSWFLDNDICQSNWFYEPPEQEWLVVNKNVRYFVKHRNGQKIINDLNEYQKIWLECCVGPLHLPLIK